MSFLHRQIRNKHKALPRPLTKQRGVVVVVALFIVALVATMSYVMMARLERDTRRALLIVRHTQAELYAEGSIVWAIDQLRANLMAAKPDQMVDRIPLKSPVNTVDGYHIQSTVYDLQSRFNLNTLGFEEAQESFARLIKAVSPEMTNEQIVSLIKNIVDWLSPSQQDANAIKYYLELPVPYRPANKPMQNASELTLVKEMTPALFQALSPYIIALPAETRVNIQTASLPVLMSLSPKMTQDAAKQLIEFRSQSPFCPQNLTSDVLKQYDIVKYVTAVSDYFLVETEVSIENQHIVLYTLLFRSKRDEKIVVTRLMQAKSVW